MVNTAATWEEALPLGNGRLGAMVFGSPDREKIQLNEDSIWSGPYRDRNNPAAKESLAVIRQLLDENRFREAEELCLETFSGLPPAQRVYQSAGDLLIDFSPDGIFGHRGSGTRSGPLLHGVRNECRELDLERSLHRLSFEHNDIVFTRECFVSAGADVFALRFAAADLSGKAVGGKISFRASLDRGVFCDRGGNAKDGVFLARDGDIPFCVMAKVVSRGGTIRSQGGFVSVHNADEALLFVDIRTGFREKDCAAACISALDRAAATDWEQLLQAHESESRAWYKRMEL
ncbi:MAG: glycoside hydrolase family 95 protein, partial [Treponema sp.]|nr:glycoside hydrolase family 95 protein [Treponema sp.]